MSESTRTRRARDRREARRARRRRAAVIVAGVLIAGLVFVAGLALGRAIEEAPDPGGSQTLRRTLEPGTLPPVTRTLTVTTAPE
jgi:hypothetical protein